MADPRLYIITDSRATSSRALPSVLAAALGAIPAGAALVQLREPHLATRELVALARDVAFIVKSYGGRLLINDRLDVALAVGAEGVHLRESSMSVARARAAAAAGGAPEHFLIGASVHSADAAVARATEGADLVVLGPVWATPSKAAYGAPLGLDAVDQAAGPVAEAGAALFGVGGVDRGDRVRDLRARGAFGAAMIRAVMSAPDPAKAAADLWEAAA